MQGMVLTLPKQSQTGAVKTAPYEIAARRHTFPWGRVPYNRIF